VPALSSLLQDKHCGCSVSFRQECVTALRWSLTVVPLQVLQEQSEKFLRAYLSDQIRGCLNPLLFAH